MSCRATDATRLWFTNSFYAVTRDDFGDLHVNRIASVEEFPQFRGIQFSHLLSVSSLRMTKGG